MKKKELSCLLVSILGIVLIVSSIALEGRVPDAVDGALMGLGAGFVGMGIPLLWFCRLAAKDPARRKQCEIESHDERNVLIRLKAKAAAGEVLSWMVLAAAWAAGFLKAPQWVTLAACGIFLCKGILEVCFMVRYQKKM